MKQFFSASRHPKLHTLKPVSSENKPETPKVKRIFSSGQRVLSRNHIAQQKWRMGTIVGKLRNIHYEVKLDSEKQSKLQKPERRVTFKLPPVLMSTEQITIAPNPVAIDPIMLVPNGDKVEPIQIQPPERRS
ncbi:hypothetical protein ILUMI_11920 [Ignelater luminosus]|uniref:Uncharacterized protein n=1 Tax=Ignelater luminosus TaxID=2038154 RepID=A0A8K0CXJ3_IGNLU|nr:hypothetical protein ILUMI_11920 [Ignelater luminosus]